MEFSLAKIKQITDDAALKGVPVKVKDIAFYILREAFGDSLVAYRACIDQMETRVSSLRTRTDMSRIS